MRGACVIVPYHTDGSGPDCVHSSSKTPTSQFKPGKFSVSQRVNDFSRLYDRLKSLQDFKGDQDLNPFANIFDTSRIYLLGQGSLGLNTVKSLSKDLIPSGPPIPFSPLPQHLSDLGILLGQVSFDIHKSVVETFSKKIHRSIQLK